MGMFGKNKSERIRDLENDVANLHVKFDNAKRQNIILERQIENLQIALEYKDKIKVYLPKSAAKNVPVQLTNYEFNISTQ
jgi:hypothetical protein